MEQFLASYPWIILIVLLWTLPWKGVALWISARKGHTGWFVALLILNTLAILDILYIFIFSKWGENKNDNEQENSAPKKDIRPMIM